MVLIACEFSQQRASQLLRHFDNGPACPGAATLRAALGWPLALSEAVGAKLARARRMATVELEGAQAAGVRYLDPACEASLRGLTQLENPPALVMTRGEVRSATPRVGIVGARDADPAALSATRQLAARYATMGVEVVSGGALGVDSYAHLGALDAGGSTIAVFGCGIDVDYPRSNRRLFRRVELHGATLSECRRDQPPLRALFPQRNRLIAALSDLLIVVCAGARSGSLSTARAAQSLGRPVWVVGGSCRRWEGNRALAEQGCAWIEGISSPPLPSGISAPVVSEDRKTVAENSPASEKVLDFLRGGPVYYELIKQCCDLADSALVELLLDLEIAGRIRRLSGNRYQKVD